MLGMQIFSTGTEWLTEGDERGEAAAAVTPERILQLRTMRGIERVTMGEVRGIRRIDVTGASRRYALGG